ncbi:unnamed protein product [Dibothriocephalus latus]|uniref:Uncharacterized protein n=1 Tax=Dibothriocephalus latus TaxID=60516 RepID=A0A3P7LDW0_DIBLA|nr:unnamed protein product [Dibothriocephalus latus]
MVLAMDPRRNPKRQDLEDKLKELEAERAQRIADYRSLRKELLQINVQMGLDAGSIKQKMNEFPPIACTLPSGKYCQVPTQKELARLRSVLEEDQSTIKPLLSKFRALQSDILRLSADIDYQPQNAKEQSVLTPDGSGDREDGQPAEANGEPTVDIDSEIQAMQAKCSGALPTEGDLEVSLGGTLL